MAASLFIPARFSPCQPAYRVHQAQLTSHELQKNRSILKRKMAPQPGTLKRSASPAVEKRTLSGSVVIATALSGHGVHNGLKNTPGHSKAQDNNGVPHSAKEK